MERLTNMSNSEDESTSESKNEGDSSDSTEDAPKQHQVRTDSNILMPKETKVSKAKEIPKNSQKAAPKLVENQSATKHALLADQTATTSGEEHVALPPKAPKLVDNQSATKAMTSDSDIDVEDHYVIEDANESASSKYVPCINYANDKVYPQDVKNGWVRLEQDTGPPNIYKFEGSCCNYLNVNNYTPGAIFDEFFEGKMWTILSENMNKYVHAKLRQAKDKDHIELLSEGADQNPCAQLNKWEDTSLDEMKVFVAHLIVMGILKKNSLEQCWSRDSILNTPFIWSLHVQKSFSKHLVESSHQ